MHGDHLRECAFSCVVTSRERVALRRHTPPANPVFMPVYSSTRCDARADRARMRERRASNTSSCALTREQHDARRKKRCVDATTRANFSRARAQSTRCTRVHRRVARVDRRALHASDARLTRVRCSTWPTTYARRAASRVPRRMRERQNAEAHRDGSIECACMPIAIRSVTPPSRCVWANASLTRIEIVRMQLRRPGDANVRCDLTHCGKTLFSND